MKEKVKEFDKYVPKVHFELIPIKNLVSNQKYQRGLSTFHIQRTAANFDVRQVNLVKVSRRNGVNYVINGQHTVEVIAAVSGSRNTPVWCMIYDDLDYTQEANVFANQQKYVKPLKPYEVFMANVEADNDEQIVILNMVEFYNLRITPQKALGGICAISTLEHIYRNHGVRVLDRVLRLCVGTWEGETDFLSANILRGITRLVVAFGDDLQDDRFKEKVGSHPVRIISRAAKERNAGTRGYAEAMLDIYNTRLNPRLNSS
ncbi:MAG: hypothetical protein FWF12_10455, partial [Betaproteobacteria bacterium]|nr:hypothetical protein [Betaproteobacteria bacterium]